LVGVENALVPMVVVRVDGLFATMFDGDQVVVAVPNALVVPMVGDVMLFASVVNTIGKPAYPKLSPVETVAVAAKVPEPAVKGGAKQGLEEAKVTATATGAVPVPYSLRVGPE